MKPIQTTLSLAIILSLFSCNKNENDCSLIPARIIRYDCDRVVFELLTDQLIGDASWTDTHTGTTYTNVVSYYHTCRIAQLTNGANDTLYVKLEKTNENRVPENCVQCAALPANPPATKVVFTEISTEGCREAVD